MPQKLSGWGLSLCNGKFWGEGLGIEAHRRGLRLIWSSEMMWHHTGEIAAARLGLMDKVLLKHLVPHGLGGFLCSTKAEWREHAQRLRADGALRQKMSKAAREFAVHELCDAAKHRAVWREVFEG